MAVDDQNGTTSAQTISPLGNHFLISSSAYSVVLDLSATPPPPPPPSSHGGSFVGRDSKKVVCFAWSIGHVVANWEGLFTFQLVMVIINGIFFGADFFLTNQGLQGFIAKKPILTYDLSAGTERRKAVLVLSGLDCLLSSHYINVGRIYHGSSFGTIVFLFSALILATCWEAFTHVALAFISCIPCPFTRIVSYNPRLLVFGIILTLPCVYWSQYEAMSREFHEAPFGLALNISGTLRPSGAYVDAPVPTIALHMFPCCCPTIFGVVLLAVAESMVQRKILYGVFLLDVSWTKTNGFLSCCGVPGWITGIALDAQNAIKIGNKLFVKPSLQVVLGYATIVQNVLKAASDATGTDATRDNEHTTMTIVSVYDLLPSLLGFHKWLPPWATPKPFGTITKHEFHLRTDLMLSKDTAYVHDRGTCVN
ncbi:hypothetical protein AeMF1_006772 [Aphanomyces euteiches]|nr:hypothetical protein AeMF1_006772 [Aphanomyces euteiches]